MADSRPIGIFDSGLGGLTIARKLADTMPHESFLYFGDTLRCPYGKKSPEEVLRFSKEIAAWLLQRDIKLLVIACNTATAAAYSTLKETLPISVIGVIEPGARAGIEKSSNKRIGVLATEATVTSAAYLDAIHTLNPKAKVFQAASPDSVDFVEELMATAPEKKEIWLQHDTEHLLAKALPIAERDCKALKEAEVDTVILGCTHFPLLKPIFQKVFGTGVTLVSSAEETQKAVAACLVDKNIKASEQHMPHHKFATTADAIERFSRGGSFIFGRPLNEVQPVSLASLTTPTASTSFASLA